MEFIVEAFDLPVDRVEEKWTDHYYELVPRIALKHGGKVHTVGDAEYEEYKNEVVKSYNRPGFRVISVNGTTIHFQRKDLIRYKEINTLEELMEYIDSGSYTHTIWTSKGIHYIGIDENSI